MFAALAPAPLRSAPRGHRPPPGRVPRQARARRARWSRQHTLGAGASPRHTAAKSCEPAATGCAIAGSASSDRPRPASHRCAQRASSRSAPLLRRRPSPRAAPAGRAVRWRRDARRYRPGGTRPRRRPGARTRIEQTRHRVHRRAQAEKATEPEQLLDAGRECAKRQICEVRRGKRSLRIVQSRARHEAQRGQSFATLVPDEWALVPCISTRTPARASARAESRNHGAPRVRPAP